MDGSVDGLVGSSDQPAEELRVSTLECFFDLVFVFAITQLTSVLGREPNAVGLAKMALLLGVIWWMYGGYAWLTNVVAPVTAARRALLVLAMAGFLLVALAVPTAFDSGGLAFGIGYLIVTSVHAGLFLTSPRARQGALRAAQHNVFSAIVLVIAAFLPEPVRWTLWVLVPIALWTAPHRRGTDDIPLRPAHFVERHGLVLLIAFGESVAAVGTGIPSLHLSIGLLLAAVLALLVLVALWWSYFGGEDELAERRLAAADIVRRAAMSLNAFGRAFYLLLAGVIMLAAGVKKAIGHPWQPGHLVEALAIAGGVLVYLVGDLLLRRTLRLGPLLPRCVAAVLVAASVAVGMWMSMVVQLVAIALVLAGAFALERKQPARNRAERRRAEGDQVERGRPEEDRAEEDRAEGGRADGRAEGSRAEGSRADGERAPISHLRGGRRRRRA
ncbi:MAG TPA: low temperature requirement protein A [Pseudonocardiaceae bacterium]|nr:low temperature requirement protein A [Pseudonocardiaceae bacterium]